MIPVYCYREAKLYIWSNNNITIKLIDTNTKIYVGTSYIILKFYKTALNDKQKSIKRKHLFNRHSFFA